MQDDLQLFFERHMPKWSRSTCVYAYVRVHAGVVSGGSWHTAYARFALQQRQHCAWARDGSPNPEHNLFCGADTLSNRSVVPQNNEKKHANIVSKAVAIVENVYISGMHLQMIEAFLRMSHTIV